jgi:hypothetical protein
MTAKKNPSGTGRWFAEVKVVGGSRTKGIMRVEKVHASLEEAQSSLFARRTTFAMAVEPFPCEVEPQVGDYGTFERGHSEALDRALEQMREQFLSVDRMVAPKLKP